MFKKIFSFKGRIRRLHFFLANLLILFLRFTAGVILGVLDLFYSYRTDFFETTFGGSILYIGMLILLIFLAIISISLLSRRFHDLNLSGWFSLFDIIPIVGVILTIILCFIKGNEGDNKYGADPKNKNIRIQENNHFINDIKSYSTYKSNSNLTKLNIVNLINWKSYLFIAFLIVIIIILIIENGKNNGVQDNYRNDKSQSIDNVVYNFPSSENHKQPNANITVNEENNNTQNTYKNNKQQNVDIIVSGKNNSVQNNYKIDKSQSIGNNTYNFSSPENNKQQNIDVLDIVGMFYYLMSVGRSEEAILFLIPEKRNKGNYQPKKMNDFYLSLQTPIYLQWMEKKDPYTVIAKVHYTNRLGKVCSSIATIKLEYRNGNPFIQSIKSKC